ncbi:hypothetical protein Scep_002168 [Stephania cephalantha]|uniref:Uncharacterized protein n=1 Tax=Stephania cephalantha TaxID=152367 RepID=A0AAP0L9F8_9MAGN
MLNENKRTLARHYSMTERRKMEHLLGPRRSIDTPLMQLRLPSGIYNPGDSYISQPNAAGNDKEVEKIDYEFAS